MAALRQYTESSEVTATAVNLNTTNLSICVCFGKGRLVTNPRIMHMQYICFFFCEWEEHKAIKFALDLQQK